MAGVNESITDDARRHLIGGTVQLLSKMTDERDQLRTALDSLLHTADLMLEDLSIIDHPRYAQYRRALDTAHQQQG